MRTGVERCQRTALAVCLFSIFAAHTAAGGTLFLNELDFVAAAGGLSFESFETQPVTGISVTSSIGTPDFTMTTAATLLGVLDGPFNSAHATDGSRYVLWQERELSPNLVFTFGGPMTAFGLTLTDALDHSTSGFALSLTTDGGDSFPSVLTSPLPDGNEAFVGFLASAPFSSVTLTHAPLRGDSMGIDAVYYRGATAPIPPTAALLLLGAAWLRLRPFRELN